MARARPRRGPDAQRPGPRAAARPRRRGDLRLSPHRRALRVACRHAVRTTVACASSCSPLLAVLAARRAGAARRPDHAARRGPARACSAGALGHPGHRDRDVRRRGRRRRRRRPRRRGAAHPLPLLAAPAIERTGVGPGLLRLADLLRRPASSGAISESVGEYGGTLGARDADRGDPRPARRAAGRHAARAADAARSARQLARAAEHRRPLAARRRASSRRAAARAASASSTPRPAARAPRRSRSSSCGPARRWRRAWPAATSPPARSAPSPTSTATASGRSATRSTAPAGASLFLQDAYVYAVVNNPVGVEGVTTYKLAAPGHDVGILSGDGLNAVAGRARRAARRASR